MYKYISRVSMHEGGTHRLDSQKCHFFVLESEQIEIYNCLVNMDLNVELVN